jgi:hypothetical protein
VLTISVAPTTPPEETSGNYALRHIRGGAATGLFVLEDFPGEGVYALEHR